MCLLSTAFPLFGRCDVHKSVALVQPAKSRSDFETAGIGGRGRPDRDPPNRSRLSGRWSDGSVRLNHGKTAKSFAFRVAKELRSLSISGSSETATPSRTT